MLPIFWLIIRIFTIYKQKKSGEPLVCLIIFFSYVELPWQLLPELRREAVAPGALSS